MRGDDETAERRVGRPVAPGGWRRGVIGLLVGLGAGAIAALLEPRERLGDRDVG